MDAPTSSHSRPPGQISKAAFFRARSPAQDPNLADRRIDNAIASGWGAVPASVNTVYLDDASEGDNRSEREPAASPTPSNSHVSHRTAMGNYEQLPSLAQVETQLRTSYIGSSHHERTHSSSSNAPANQVDPYGGVENPARLSAGTQVQYSQSRTSTRRGQTNHRRNHSTAESIQSIQSTSKSHHKRTMSQTSQVQNYGMPTPSPETETGVFKSDSDDLLMTLLAGQAAMDCQNMAVARWEAVEDWKKELSLLSSRLSSQVAKFQREQKILTAAKTLAKLNVGNKRMSRQTDESVAVAEQKAADAEKEMLFIRDRESALRRTLMEHWAGVMAWEVRRLESVVKQAEARAEKAAQDSAEVASLRKVARRAQALESESRELVQDLEESNGRIRQHQEEAHMLKSELHERDERITQLEAALQKAEIDLSEQHEHGARMATEADKHRSRVMELEEHLDELDAGQSTRIQELEQSVQQSNQERDQWIEERIQLREEAEEGKMKANMWETAKLGAAQALGLEMVASVTDMVDGIKRLSSTVKDRDEELKVVKEEMREVGLGLESEIGRLADERDSLRAKLEQVEGRTMQDATAKRQQIEEYEIKIKVSLLCLWFVHDGVS